MGPRRFRRGCRIYASRRPSRERSFNGAATFPSRMFTISPSSSATIMALQWGRDVSVADVTTKQNGASMVTGFNGAATFPSRMSGRRASAPAGSAARFNGAATFPSRMS